MQKSSVALIGFMGAYKSSAGSKAAALLGLDFFDSDSLFYLANQVSAADYIMREGERAFRLLEGEILGELATKRNAVIATGGGAVLNLKAIKRLRESALVINLRCGKEELYNRVKNSRQARPLASAAEEFFALFDKREQLYERFADRVIDTSARDSDSVAEEIKRLYLECN